MSQNRFHFYTDLKSIWLNLKQTIFNLKEQTYSQGYNLWQLIVKFFKWTGKQLDHTQPGPWIVDIQNSTDDW